MEPIFISDLFEELDHRLLDCLRSLTKEDWNRQTVARHWKVKNVAAHLLEGNIRTLSMGRDGYYGEKPPHIDGYQDLVGWLNQLNFTKVIRPDELLGQVPEAIIIRGNPNLVKNALNLVAVIA